VWTSATASISRTPLTACTRSRSFPGSSIGNFDPDDAVHLMRDVAEMVGEGGHFLIGVDLKKPVEILNAAYNDAAGITAAFTTVRAERRSHTASCCSGSMRWPRCASRTASTGATAPRRSTTASASEMVESGGVHRLNPEKRPNSFLARSTRATSPGSRTAPSSAPSARRTPARPTTGWTRQDATAAQERFDGCMRGRTMYVIPFSMGPLGSPDRPHRRRDHRLALRRRQPAHHDPHGPAGARRARRATASSCPACTVLVRRWPGEQDVPWPCAPNVEDKYITHFPETREIWSYGSGLRRQRPARQEVLRAAHRLGHGARRGLAGRAHADPRRRSPRGQEDIRRRRLPERLRQDQLRHADPARGLRGLEGHHVGDDIAWIKPNRGRQVLRHQPRVRLLRRRPGTNDKSNPNAMPRCTPTASSPTVR
jgi:hypothetical protein